MARHISQKKSSIKDAAEKKLTKKSRVKDAAKKVLKVFRVDPAYAYEC